MLVIVKCQTSQFFQRALHPCKFQLFLLSLCKIKSIAIRVRNGNQQPGGEVKSPSQTISFFNRFLCLRQQLTIHTPIIYYFYYYYSTSKLSLTFFFLDFFLPSPPLYIIILFIIKLVPLNTSIGWSKVIKIPFIN